MSKRPGRRSEFDEVPDRSRLHTMKWEFERQRLDDPGLLSFGTADMDFRSPLAVQKALEAVAASGHYGYPHKPPSYFSAIVDFYGRRFGWRVEPSWIGADVGVYASMGALIDQLTAPGEEIIYQTPVHKVFRDVVSYAQRIPVEVPLNRSKGRYTMDFSALKQSMGPRTRMLLLCNPHNPVGRAWTYEELMQVHELCARRGVVVVSDEVYCGLMYPGEKFTPFASICAEASGNSITLFSASKSFNLTGLKHSIVISENADYRAAFHRALKKGDIQYGGSIFGQVACEVALRECDAWSAQLMKYVAANFSFLRKYLKSSLPKASVVEPEATYLAWIDLSRYGIAAKELQALLEQQAGIILTYGHTMGPGGEGHVRLNMATQRSVLESGLQRMAAAINTHREGIC